MDKGRNKKVVLLDRDGTINVDSGYVHKIEDWKFVDGSVEALKKLQKNGFILTVVTNQSGIGHGLYGKADMEKLHQHMLSELEQSGVVVAAIAFCPHHREAGCGCRKPDTGMVRQIEEKIDSIDFQESWTIGDKIADVEFGQRLGTRTVLIRSKYWDEEALQESGLAPNHIVESLFEAAEIIIK